MLEKEHHHAHELHHDKDGELEEATVEGTVPIVKLPRMIHRVLHDLEGVLDLVLHAQVEEEGANPPTDHHSYVGWRLSELSRRKEHMIVKEDCQGDLGEDKEAESAFN